jgi:hypothetical protein
MAARAPGVAGACLVSFMVSPLSRIPGGSADRNRDRGRQVPFD